MGYPEAALSCHPGCLWTKAKAKHCTKSLKHPLKPYPNSLGTKAEAQKCTGICQTCSAKGTTLQPCKPSSYSFLLLYGI